MRKTMLPKGRTAALSAARGFSLVEALVALVVMSIGLLGIAALYVESLRSGTSALLRSQAVALASDMADRIRANPTAAGAYDKAVDATGAVVANCENATGCTPAEMASTDIARWYQLVDDRGDNPAQGRLALPGGRGTVVSVAGPPRVYTITVSWLESGQTTASTYALRLQL